ncbi:hypothetical protein KM043_017761 [Ampulex compressa]|nr:hypothetical protein KM043_017761 [Ampulex compressa]
MATKFLPKSTNHTNKNRTKLLEFAAKFLSKIYTMKASTERRSGRRAPPRRSSTASLLARTNNVSQAKHSQLEKSPSTENLGKSMRNDASVGTTTLKTEALRPPKTRFSAEDGFRESNRSSSSSRLKSFPVERIRKLDSPPPFSPSPIAALIVQQDPRETGTFHVAPLNNEAHQDCGDAQFSSQHEKEQYGQQEHIMHQQVIPRQQIESYERAHSAFKQSFPQRKVSPRGQAHRPFVPNVPHAMATHNSALEAASASAIHNPQLTASFPHAHFDTSTASMPVEHPTRPFDDPLSSLDSEKQPVGGRNAAMHRRALQERKHAQSLPSLVANTDQANPRPMQDNQMNVASMHNYVPLEEDRGYFKIHDAVHGQYMPQQNERSMPEYFQQNLRGMPCNHYDYSAQRHWKIPGQGMTSPQDLATNQLKYFRGVPTCDRQGLFMSQNNLGYATNNQSDWTPNNMVTSDRSNTKVQPKTVPLTGDRVKYVVQHQQQSAPQQSLLYDSQNVATVNQHQQYVDSKRGCSLVHQYPTKQRLIIPNPRSSQSHGLQVVNQGNQNEMSRNISISPDIMCNHNSLVPATEQYGNSGQNAFLSQTHRYPIPHQQANLNAQSSFPQALNPGIEKHINRNENPDNLLLTPKRIDNRQSLTPVTKYGDSGQFDSLPRTHNNSTFHKQVNPDQQAAQQKPCTSPRKNQDPEKQRHLQFTPDMMRDQEFLLSTMRQQNIPDDIMRRQFDALLCEQRRHLAYLEQLRSQEEAPETKRSSSVFRKRKQTEEKPEWMIHITPPRVSYEEILRSRMQDKLQREQDRRGKGILEDHHGRVEQQVTMQREAKEILNGNAASEQIHSRHQQGNTCGRANDWRQPCNRERTNDWHRCNNWHRASNVQQAGDFEDVDHSGRAGNFQQPGMYQETSNWDQAARLEEAGNVRQVYNCKQKTGNAPFSTTSMNLPPCHRVAPTWSNKLTVPPYDPSFMVQHQQHCQCQSHFPWYSQQYWNPQIQRDTLQETRERINSLSDSNTAKNSENRGTRDCEPSSLLKMRIYKEVIRPQKRNNGLQDPETIQRALATLKDAESRRGFEYLANLTKRKPVVKLNGIQEPQEVYFEQQPPVSRVSKKIPSNGLENTRNPNNPPVQRLSLVKKSAKQVAHEYPRQRIANNARNCYSMQAERENGTMANNRMQSELERAQFQNKRNCTSMENTVVPSTKFDANYPQFYQQQCYFKRQKLCNEQAIGGQNHAISNGEGDVGSTSLQNTINNKNENGAAGDAVGTSNCSNELPGAMQSEMLPDTCCNRGQSDIQETKTIGGVTYLARKANCIPNSQIVSANALCDNGYLQPQIVC